MDEEINSVQKELDQCRLKVDDWERVKIKWNRHKKELLELIEDAEKSAINLNAEKSSEFEKSDLIEENEDHQNNQIQQLYNKYQKIGE